MGDDETFVIVSLLFSLATFSLGMYLGDSIGMKSVYKGIYTCQTLPDNEIYCYKTNTIKN